MKTAELTGAALDWAVAKCEGEKFRWQPEYDDIGQEYDAHHYSTDWAQGGPIIEREQLRLTTNVSGGWTAQKKLWTDDSTASGQMRWFSGSGATPLVAAMRCFCASKLGDEVEVPGELK